MIATALLRESVFIARSPPLRYTFGTMTFPRTAALVASASLLLVGAGCSGAPDQLASDVVRPVTVSVEALQKAQQLSADQKARVTYDAEQNTNEVGVVMILLDGDAVPAGVQVGDVIGCNDRPAVAQLSRDAATGDTVKDALTTLFAVRESTVGKLHNSLADSRLAVDKIQSTDGVTTEVWLKGTLSSGGVCDDPRIKEQVEGTVRRLRPTYKIFLNGTESAWRCFGNMSGNCK